MFRKLIIIASMIVILAFTGCSAVNEQKPSKENTQRPEKTVDPIREQIKKMTLEDKIGQMVIAGFEGYTVDGNTRTLIEDYHIGGFILFGRNVDSPDQLLNLINSLKDTNSGSKVPLFVSVDEEGGRVSRMPSQLVKLPSNKTIGKAGSNISYKIGKVLAEETASFGFNMDFAPVLDINSNPQNPVIGDRAFGSDEKIVTRLGVETMKGIRAGGVIPVVKHFPGHGDTSVDSHVGLPSVVDDMDRLKRFELVPFNDAIRNGADAVMVAHILLTRIDPGYPASLSKTIITDLLRKQLNFNGVVLTDDMTMGAIVKNYSIGSAAVRSVNAGSDIVLVCHGYDNELTVINSLKKAVEDGSIKENRVDESVYRILKLKQKYRLSDSPVASIDINKINSHISAVLDAGLQAK